MRISDWSSDVGSSDLPAMLARGQAGPPKNENRRLWRTFMSGRILVADDEPYIVEAITFLLSHQGYQVTAVEDGAAVMPAIADAKPDLLILDIKIGRAHV